MLHLKTCNGTLKPTTTEFYSQKMEILAYIMASQFFCNALPNHASPHCVQFSILGYLVT